MHIQHLPNEIVGEIIRLRSDIDDFMSPHPHTLDNIRRIDGCIPRVKPFPRVAMQVCNRWREIVVTSPLFFVLTIALQSVHWDELSGNHMLEAMNNLVQVFEYYRGCDIDLRLDIDEDIDPNMGSILPSAAFLHLVTYIFQNFSDNLRFIDAHAHPSMRLFLTKTISDAHSFSRLLWFKISSLEHPKYERFQLPLNTPLLKHLSIDGIPVDVPHAGTSLCHSLESLVLTELQDSTPTWQEFSELLIRCPRLKHLKFDAPTSAITRSVEQTLINTSSSLISLNIYAPFDDMIIFIETLPLPLLESLTLNSSSIPSRYPETPISLPRLSSLELVNIGGYSTLVILESVGIPNLSSLEVRDPPSSEVLQWSFDNVVLPNLASLSIRGHRLCELFLFKHLTLPVIEKLETNGTIMGHREEEEAKYHHIPWFPDSKFSFPSITSLTTTTFPSPALAPNKIDLSSLTNLSIGRINHTANLHDPQIRKALSKIRSLTLLLDGGEESLRLLPVFHNITTLTLDLRHSSYMHGYVLGAIFTKQWKVTPFPFLETLKMWNYAPEWIALIKVVLGCRIQQGCPIKTLEMSPLPEMMEDRVWFRERVQSFVWV